MRNLFDQHNQPENRLSHALAVCLNEDRALLRKFLTWNCVKAPIPATKLVIDEQSLPGDPVESDEEQAERKGLPDIVIHDGSSWCLLIESKVQATLTQDQLTRHERTLERRGFQRIQCMTLTKTGDHPKSEIALTWSGLYEWLGRARQRGEWSERLRAYLRSAEARLARENYLTEGTLTMFDGFQFSDDNPYTYGEAKRLLKLAITELRKNKSLKALGVDLDAKGRGAITGRGQRSVWDVLLLTDRPKKQSFRSYPHLTLAVHVDHLEVAITIPNRVAATIRRRLGDQGTDGPMQLNSNILKRGQKIISLDGWIEAYALQRHYPSRTKPVADARMDFKLETGIDPGRDGIKFQPEWLGLFAELLKRKQVNVQFVYATCLPWGIRGLDNGEDSLRLIINSWNAMKPLLDKFRGK